MRVHLRGVGAAEDRAVRAESVERIVYRCHPMTVTLLCGLAFAGKSTLAAAMARRLGVAVVSLDEINAARGLHGGTGIPVEEWAATHQRAFREIESALKSGSSSCRRRRRPDLRDNDRETVAAGGHRVCDA